MPQELEVLPPRESEGRRILSTDPANAEAAPDAFGSLITPAGHRFVRCHFPVPEVGGDHAIQIAGAAVRRRLLTLQHLRALPSVTQTILTECAGNSRASIQPAVNGEQWTSGAVSTAQWTGVPLRSVLDLRDTAVEVVFTGADGGEYQRSLPRDVALEPSTILAYEMNGLPVPARFGGPVRLVVPAWYGMASVKWVARIEAVEEPFHGEFQSRKYVYAPGVPVTRIRIKSIFVSPPALVRAGAPVRIAGLAWGGDGVHRVEVEVDGEPRRARLVGPALPHAWRRFELDWIPRVRGRHVLACRATDIRGCSQPDNPEWNPLGYGAHGVQRVAIIVT